MGEIRTVPIDTLTPHPRNPRRRTDNLEAIRGSIRRNGWYGTLIVQAATGYVCAGNHRMQAAAAEGYTELPAEFLDIDDATALRIVLADNRTSDTASYEDDVLAELLAEVRDQAGGLDGTAFDDSYLEQMRADLTRVSEHERRRAAAGSEPEPETPPADPVTRAGDLWIIGPHRLLCADARLAATWVTLCDGDRINLAFTSPPYADRRTYDESSGFRPVPPDEYVEWFAPVAAGVAAHLADNGSWFVNIKAGADGLDTELYVLDLVLAHVRQWGWHWLTEFCWERNGVPKQVVLRFKNQFEAVYQFVRDRPKIRPENVQHASDNVPISLGAGSGDTSWASRQGHHGVIPENRRPRKNGTARLISDVQGTAHDAGEALHVGWAYPGNRLPTFNGTHEATGHTAAFPVGLPQWFIRAYTDPDDIVVDPFVGSGSTILAAHNEHRRGYGIELSPAYCDVTLARIQRHTGIKPERGGHPADFLTT